jgi:hypothetical protein
MGAGLIDPGGNRKGSAFNPGLVYDAGFFEYVGFLCDAAPQAVSAAFCAQLEAAGVPTESYNLNYPSIGVAEVPGTRTITRTLTNVSNQTIRVSADVEKPKGFDVIVRPRRLSIPAGGTASFEVTFNTTKAPIGEWRFGSLEWEGSGFDVRSPIALRAAQIEVPEVVTGNGETGLVDIPVQFGYTGAYAAAGHGLVPAALTEDTVLQDPDQTFDPDDGLSNVHTFDLTGDAVFKLAMPQEATGPNTDIDIYLADPSGAIVAASTAPGTVEEIIIQDPVPGVWTVYIHGWQTESNTSSPYTLYTWEVSAAAGGTLVIESAPTEAVSGATGTVTASWSGATTGQWHLGFVSHNEGTDVIARTLVDIDNR